MSLTIPPADAPSPDQGQVSGDEPALDLELRSSIESLMVETRAMLRRRIWTETMQRVFVAAIVWFFSVWALDYFPIWLGASELPQAARLGLLLIGVAVIGWILVCWGWSRAAVKASDESVALLLERKYPQLSDRLATLVSWQSSAVSRNLAGEKPHFGEDPFLRGTTDGLLEDLKQVQIRKLFDWTAVHRWTYYCWIGLSLLLLSVFISGPWFQIAFYREVLLDARRWPRQSDIELGRLQPVLDPRLSQLLGEVPKLNPIQGQYRIGRGSDLEITVEAATNAAAESQSPSRAMDQFHIAGFESRVPRRCVMTYQSIDGSVGRQYLIKFGQTQNGKEGFLYDGPPLQRMSDPLSVTIYGDDDRVGPLELVPVDNAALLQIELQCKFPEYLERSGGTLWLPQTLRWTEGIQLPVGTNVLVKVTFSKPVQRLLLAGQGSDQNLIEWQDETAVEEVRLPLGELVQNQTWELWSQDVDQVWSSDPMVFAIGAQADQAPVVQVDLEGIENAVTPDAILPLVSNASDDYGLQQVWAKLELPVNLLADDLGSFQPREDQEEPRTDLASLSRLETNMSADGQVENQFRTLVDLRQWYEKHQKVAALSVDQQKAIQLQVIASDYFERDGKQHQSVSQTIHLEVVSPAALLRLLKRSEVGQRRRLEQIYDELMDQRFYLQRADTLVKEATLEAGSTVLPAAETPNVESQETVAQASDPNDPSDGVGVEAWEMVNIFARRAKNQNEKSRQELVGVQTAFERIVMQIVNNRLEAAEYRRRLEANIIRSMEQLTSVEIVKTGSRLKQVEEKFDLLNENGSRVSSEADRELLQADLALAAESNDRCLKILDQVLQDLLKFESDAELYELVRDIYDNQKKLMDETGRQQQEQAFEDLFGN